MSSEDASLLPDAIKIALQITALFDELEIPYLIGGSVASTVHGEARMTNDLDLVARLKEQDVPALVSALEADFYLDEYAIQRAIRDRSSFNLIYLGTMFKVDVFIDRGDDWAREQFTRSVAKSLLQGKEATSRKVSDAETTILQKLLWYVKGGGVSDRQWNDVLGMLKVQGEALDYDYLRRWAERLQISRLLEKAFEDAGVGA